MKRVLVGGPLLGSRSRHDGIESWKTLEPLVSEPMLGGDKADRIILLPNDRFVTALSYRTGKRIATLLPGLSEKDEVLIQTAVLVSFKTAYSSNKAASVNDSNSKDNELALLVGMADGSLHEFHLQCLLDHEILGKVTSESCGAHHISGPTLRPRRILQLAETGQPILHLASVCVHDATYVYAIVQHAVSSRKSAVKLHASLVRTQLSPYSASKAKCQKVDLRTADGSDVLLLDELKYTIKSKEEKKSRKLPPFGLHAVVCASSTSEDPCIVALIPTPWSLSLYVDRPLRATKGQQRIPGISIPAPVSNSLSAISVASNGKDVALGHWAGDIRILDNLLPAVETYVRAMARRKLQNDREKSGKPKHPANSLVARRLHWHAHPVSSLAFDSTNTLLYSGGDESVLVTWQLTRGSYRPAEVLPRLALGGIIYLTSVPAQSSLAGGILVYCDDNTLQMFEPSNKTIKWKVKGLAARLSRELISSRPTLRVERPHYLVLSGLPQAPGYIQWYDSYAQQVVASLEVVPFNRISRTEPTDSPMPAPNITHAVYARNFLVTVDTVATENCAIGAYHKLPNGGGVGIVTTIRFWEREESTQPSAYELVAAMSYPHGPGHIISALAISNDGMRCCTVSNDENAFRLWQRTSDVGDDDDTKPSVRWACQYKISTPAAYSRFPAGRNAVAFSDDASTLAIAYGSLITLWDCQEVSLTTSQRHLDDEESPVESLSFLSSDRFMDMLFSVSTAGVTLQSPFGSLGPSNVGWQYIVSNQDASFRKVSHAAHLPSCALVAIAVYDSQSDASQIILVDEATGQVQKFTGTHATCLTNIPGEIVAIASKPKTVYSSWGAAVGPSNTVTFYTLTSRGAVILFDSHADETRATDTMPLDVDANAPKIPMLAGEATRTAGLKRDREDELEVNFGVSRAKKGTLSSDLLALFEGDEPPRLTDDFVRSFLIRALRR